MSIPLIMLVTGIYIAVAVSEYYANRMGMAGMFLGYAFANLGVMASIRGY